MYFNDSNMSDEESDGEKEEIKHCSFFFFVPGPGRNHTPFLYFDSPNDKINNLRGISMNADWLFLWNDGFVWKLDLHTHERK